MVCTADYIVVVYSCSETMDKAQGDHEINLMKRYRETYVKLSYEKSMFNRIEIQFMGHLITTRSC